MASINVGESGLNRIITFGATPWSWIKHVRNINYFVEFATMNCFYL